MESDATTLENKSNNFFKLNTHLSYDQGILLSSIYPEEIKAYIQTKSYTQMFMPSLHVIVKNC